VPGLRAARPAGRPAGLTAVADHRVAVRRHRNLLPISPLGRRSGAHFNPVVTLAFFTRGKVHPHDLAGYIAAQLSGAVAGHAVLRLLWGREATTMHLGVQALTGRGGGRAHDRWGRALA